MVRFCRALNATQPYRQQIKATTVPAWRVQAGAVSVWDSAAARRAHPLG
jgi:hypothetical protein